MDCFGLRIDECNQAKNMMSLLQPLAEATNILCASKYPNLKPEIPIDVIILKYLFVARRELYEQSQLIFPANLIIKKK